MKCYEANKRWVYLICICLGFILFSNQQEDKLKTSFAANKNDLKSIKSAISCIRFLLVNAARFQTDGTTFSTELQQLGLPVEHSAAISRVFNEQNENIQKHLIDTSFTGDLSNYFLFATFLNFHYLYVLDCPFAVNELVDMSYEIPKEAIDCACISFKLKNELVNGVPTQTTHDINIGRSDIKILLKELKTVRNFMDETNWNGCSGLDSKSFHIHIWYFKIEFSF